MTEELTAVRDEIAAAFDRSNDPLAAHASTFSELDVDPFEVFVEESLSTRDVTEQTINTYRIAFRHWQSYMADRDRHPACPNEDHVGGFVDWLADEHDNHPKTIKGKLSRLNEVYNFWQEASEFPHSRDYNPVALVYESVSFEVPDLKEHPPLTTGELSAILRSITHRRNRLIILLHLKLGLRATELCNIQLQDVSLEEPVLQDHYDTLGSHWCLEGRPNALYVPHDRPGNKSGQPRVLPLDAEVQELLTRYLISRPDVAADWVFLSKEKHGQLGHQDLTSIWKSAFHPMYEETEHYRPVTSHFGRHFFTTYWRVERELPRPLTKYMRGDSPGNESIQDRAGIDHYIHTYYEDIEPLFRQGRIFNLTV